jgi:ribosomal protein S18 acetylase RimI-like enzyme
MMKKAEDKDKEYIVDILAQSFDTNQSINYLVPQDKKRLSRLKALMDYSVEFSRAFGEVLISEDHKACALILFPDKEKINLTSILLDIKLIWYCLGVSHIYKALSLKSRINQLRPKNKLMYYLWFIGVNPKDQHAGAGSKLLKEIIAESQAQGRPIYLETSTIKNLSWYQRFGFKIYNELNIGYRLFFLKND